VQTTTVIEEKHIAERNEAEGLSVKDIFFKYIRFLPVFILSLAVALFGSYTYLRYATPIYRASGTILIKNNQTGNNNQGGDPKLNQLFLNQGAQNIQNEIEVLRSKPLMQRVVDSLNLQISYYAVGKIKSPNIYKQGPFLLHPFEIRDSSKPFSLNIKFSNNNQFTVNGEKSHFTFGELFRNRFGVFRLDRNPFSGLGKEYTVTWKPTDQVAATYASSIIVTPKPNTGILQISLETTNPLMSSDILNQLMIEYGEQTREEKNKEARQTLKFIDIRLDTLQNEIDDIQRIILSLKRKYNLISPEAQMENYFQNATEAQKGINEQRLQMNVAQMIEDYLVNKQNQFSTVPTPLTLMDQAVSGFTLQYNTAQLERKRLMESNVPATNPLVKETEQMIEKLRTNILQAIKNVKASQAATISALQGTGGTAKAELEQLPAQMKELADIQTKLKSKTDLYEFLMGRREETSISLASSTPNSKVIDQAYPSPVPVKPNKRAIQLMAMLIGLGLPALVVFMLEIVNDKVTTRFDIEKITTAPLLGEVGHSYADKAMIVTKTNRGMVAEQFRIIRSNLQYFLNKVEKPVILVTSSFSGEGKSFITTNLGAVMALAGKRTIIIEFDIRKPKIFSSLGLAKRPGVTNYIMGKARLDELPVLVPGYDNLYALSCGPVPPNPAEMLLESRVNDLFDHLKENFDVILIDTAPVGMVSDAMTLGRFANASLYIVRQGHTYKKQVHLIDEFYREGKLPKVSIVINDVKVKPGYGYYGYGRYGYGYGYKSNYYEEEDPPQNLLGRFFGLFDLKNRRNGRPKG
jgi:capsular exopolysaccharide synthesis family protein